MTWSLLERELARPFGGFFDELVGAPRPAGNRAPRLASVNAWAGPEDAIVSCELPGVRPEDIEVTADGDVLTIRGERKAPELGSEARVHRLERPYGKFERQVYLPFPAQTDEIEARYENGVLVVRLPRSKETRPRRIEVQAASNPAVSNEGKEE